MYTSPSFALFQGSGNPGASDVDPLDPLQEQNDNGSGEEEEKKDEGGDDVSDDDENRKPQGEDEPPAFGVEGEGGDSSVLEAAKEEVRALDCAGVLGGISFSRLQ